MTKETPSLTDLREFLFNAALYAEYKVRDGSPELKTLYNRNKVTIDGHCPFCGFSATFNVEGQSIPSGTPWDEIQKRIVTKDEVVLHCTRTQDHKIRIFFRINQLTVQKVGQFPSLADIALDESKQYRSVLDREDSSELHKAIGLAAHGVGVGSFVYLRRIFERLIYKRFYEAKETNSWSAEDFFRLRMNEKVSFLDGYLPQFLVANSKIYSILSLGIHELTEAQCLSFFEILKQSIIIILDEDKRRKEEEARRESFSRAIAGFNSSTESR